MLAFREDRIKKMRVMYPLVARKPLRVGFGGSQTASRKSLTSTKRSRRTTAKVSPAVAPPTMFQKDKGLRNSDVATRINRMLCTRAYKICDIGDNTPELTQNVALIREDDKDRELGEGPWSCLSKRPSQEKYKREMLCGPAGPRARADALGADAGSRCHSRAPRRRRGCTRWRSLLPPFGPGAYKNAQKPPAEAASVLQAASSPRASYSRQPARFAPRRRLAAVDGEIRWRSAYKIERGKRAPDGPTIVAEQWMPQRFGGRAGIKTLKPAC